MKKLLLLLLIAAAYCHVQAQTASRPEVIEPTYTVDPVVTKTPHCPDGYKLQQFECGNMGGCGYGVSMVTPEQMGGWSDVPPPKPDRGGPHEGDFRCAKVHKPKQ